MNIMDYAKIIWDYHHMNHKIEKADCIMALGSHDTRVAERAAELYLKGWAPIMVCSGYLGRLTSGSWERPEADIFADIAISMGVPEQKILIENRSTNTGENVILSRKLMNDKGIFPQKVIAVHKPYMERRAYATIKKVWPEVELIVTSPQYTLENYPVKEFDIEAVINIMVGDFQRIMLYPSRGFQIPQEIPDYVYEAYKKLIEAGYDKHIINV